MPHEPSIFLAGEHPDHPGLNKWRMTDLTGFNGAVLGLAPVRLDGPRRARLRMFPKQHMTNVNNDVHGAGDAPQPLDSLVEVIKETGRMIFSRGTVVQDDTIVSSFSGIIRKPSLQ